MLRHVPTYRGADGLGYGRCQEDGELWPCAVARTPARPAPDPERDKRVAQRRAEDARRAGAALDRLLAVGAMAPEIGEAFRKGYGEGYHDGWSDGYAALEEHHNRHYGVFLPTGGKMPADCCPSTTDACSLGSCPRRRSPAWCPWSAGGACTCGQHGVQETP